MVPQWDPEKKVYTLPFYDRASLTSVHNFMLARPEAPDDTQLLCGKRAHEGASVAILTLTLTLTLNLNLTPHPNPNPNPPTLTLTLALNLTLTLTLALALTPTLTLARRRCSRCSRAARRS